MPLSPRALLARRRGHRALAVQSSNTGDRTIQLMASSSWLGARTPSSACPDHRP
jgi:hypothetical protein